MPDEEEDVEDISMTAKETAKIKRKKAASARENPSQTNPVECPDCKCDYIIPLMKLHFTKSFAGNRITVTWPSREGPDDMALVACPNCKIVYKVDANGSFKKTGKYWTEK